MTYHFTIIGRLGSLNEYIQKCRKHPQAGNKFKREYQDIVLWHIPQGKCKPPVRILYKFYEPNEKRDLDNISSFAHKVIQDALVEKGFIPDDSVKYIKGYTDMFFLDREKPRIEVTITEVDEDD